MPEQCADGTGAWIGMTVVTDAFCRPAAGSGSSGNQVTETQALIRLSTDPITVDSLVATRSMGPWTVTKDVFDSPRTDDGCGSLTRKRFGCRRQHDAWTAVIEYNGEFDLLLLIGAAGTIRRGNPDGSYREAYGEVVSATVYPNQSAEGEESLGEISVQWEGGAQGDRGFPVYVPAP